MSSSKTSKLKPSEIIRKAIATARDLITTIQSRDPDTQDIDIPPDSLLSSSITFQDVDFVIDPNILSLCNKLRESSENYFTAMSHASFLELPQDTASSNNTPASNEQKYDLPDDIAKHGLVIILPPRKFESTLHHPTLEDIKPSIVILQADASQTIATQVGTGNQSTSKGVPTNDRRILNCDKKIHRRETRECDETRQEDSEREPRGQTRENYDKGQEKSNGEKKSHSKATRSQVQMNPFRIFTMDTLPYSKTVTSTMSKQTGEYICTPRNNEVNERSLNNTKANSVQSPGRGEMKGHENVIKHEVGRIVDNNFEHHRNIGHRRERSTEDDSSICNEKNKAFIRNYKDIEGEETRQDVRANNVFLSITRVDTPTLDVGRTKSKKFEKFTIDSKFSPISKFDKVDVASNWEAATSMSLPRKLVSRESKISPVSSAPAFTSGGPTNKIEDIYIHLPELYMTLPESFSKAPECFNPDLSQTHSRSHHLSFKKRSLVRTPSVVTTPESGYYCQLIDRVNELKRKIKSSRRTNRLVLRKPTSSPKASIASNKKAGILISGIRRPSQKTSIFNRTNNVNKERRNTKSRCKKLTNSARKKELKNLNNQIKSRNEKEMESPRNAIDLIQGTTRSTQKPKDLKRHLKKTFHNSSH